MTSSEGLSNSVRMYVVDPIFRGSRLFYSWMAHETYAGANPTTIVTRQDFQSTLFSEFFAREPKMVAELKLPDGFWYGKLSLPQIQSLVDSIPETASASGPAHIHFSGLNEIFPEILSVLAQKFGARAHEVSFSFVEYDARFLLTKGTEWQDKLDKINGFIKTFPRTRVFLLDDRLEELQGDEFYRHYILLPDPAPMEQSEIADVQSDRTASELWRDDGATRATAVGRQNRRKGLADLMRASRLMEATSSNVQLYLLGQLDDTEEFRRNELIALHRAGKLTWRDEYVSEKEIRRVYRDTDYVVMPYERSFEGSSGVFAYAAAFGKPMVASDHGVIGDRIKRHKLGYAVPSGNAARLAEVMQNLPDVNSTEYRKLAANVKAYFATHSMADFRTKLLGETAKASNMPVARPEPCEPKGGSLVVPVSSPVSIQTTVETLLRQPAGREYKQILLLDTSVASKNMGDLIIMDSIKTLLRFFFPHALFVNIPTHEYIGTEGLKLLAQADYAFVCGTNLLCSNADEYKQWKLQGADAFVLSNLILLGVGWWQYQDDPNGYTTRLYRKILSTTKLHSTRDDYTRAKLGNIGISNVVNTCCPTTWFLTRSHLAALPRHRQDAVVFTFTDYAKNPARDADVLRKLMKQYGEVHVWLQGTGDFSYAKELGIEGLKYIAPTVQAYDEFLETTACDYVGTRLHAGIRALQKGRNALILAVDNRALEISRDVNLPVIDRNDVAAFDAAMRAEWNCDIAVPYDRIASWGRQFGLPDDFDLEFMLDKAYGRENALKASPTARLGRLGTIYVADKINSENYSHYFTTFVDFADGESLALKLFRFAGLVGIEFRPRENETLLAGGREETIALGMQFDADDYGEYVRLFVDPGTKEASGGTLSEELAARIERMVTAIRHVDSGSAIVVADALGDAASVKSSLIEIAEGLEAVVWPVFRKSLAAV